MQVSNKRLILEKKKRKNNINQAPLFNRVHSQKIMIWAAHNGLNFFSRRFLYSLENQTNWKIAINIDAIGKYLPP